MSHRDVSNDTIGCHVRCHRDGVLEGHLGADTLNLALSNIFLHILSFDEVQSMHPKCVLLIRHLEVQCAIS